MRNALIFYAIALSLAGLIALAQPVFGNATPLVTMLTPTVAALAMLIWIAPEGAMRQVPARLALNRAGVRGWPLAAAAPIGLHLVGIAVMILSGLAVFIRPEGESVIDMAINLLVNLAIGTLFAVFEEIGWRGYMLPRVAGIGAVSAMLLTGFLHGLWHMPLLLGTDLYHPGAAPIFAVPLFLITLTLAGVFYGYLRASTGSVWPVAIAHGAANVGWQILNTYNKTKTQLVQDYIGGESGVVVITGLLVLCALLVPTMRRPEFSIRHSV